MTVSMGLYEDFALAKVAAGQFPSLSDVVQEGLRLLKEREDHPQGPLDAAIEKAIADCDAGLVIPGDQAWAELWAWRSSLGIPADK